MRVLEFRVLEFRVLEFRVLGLMFFFHTGFCDLQGIWRDFFWGGPEGCTIRAQQSESSLGLCYSSYGGTIN